MNAIAAPSRRPKRLRTQVGILVAAISVVASVSAGLLGVRQTTKLMHEASQAHAMAVLDALAVPAAVAIADNDLAKLDSFVNELARRNEPTGEIRKDIMSLEVFDLEGRVLATSKTGMVGVAPSSGDDTFLARALLSEGPYFEFEGDPQDPTALHISKPIELGQRWGTLVARFSLSHYMNRLSDRRKFAFGLAAISALVGWLVTVYLLERLMVQPVRRLARLAKRLGEGELDLRTAYHRPDEIGDLARSLNTMARRLETYTTSLEGAVRERTADLQAANRRLERLATTDGLTGLRNHRFFQETLEFELKRAARHPRPLTLCMLDVDHFKQFNDTHGHPAGDEVLRTVARLLEQRLRSTDIVARYGGEEFAVVLLDTDREGSLALAASLCEVVREARFDGAETQPLGGLTISVGVATFPDDGEDRATLIRRADAALYAAKRQGRDRVVQWDPELPESVARNLPTPTADLTDAVHDLTAPECDASEEEVS